MILIVYLLCHLKDGFQLLSGRIVFYLKQSFNNFLSEEGIKHYKKTEKYMHEITRKCWNVDSCILWLKKNNDLTDNGIQFLSKDTDETFRFPDTGMKLLALKSKI
jgi:hypothetical protein